LTEGPALSPATPAIELVSTRRLLAAAFELIARSSDDMRRASFYIGVIVIGTVGPLAMGLWAVEVASADRPPATIERLLGGGVGAALTVAGGLALIGFFVAAIESRALAAALLGGRVAAVPVTPRQALARSRRTFWSVVGSAFLVGIVLGVAQGVASVIATAIVGSDEGLSPVVTIAATAMIGAPFAYVLSGVVLGDVSPTEAVRRSFVVFRARKVAAAVVVVFETIAFLLILLGASAGLDLATRILDALGLGLDSGPAGLLLMTAGLAAIVFAFGTLLYTVTAITVAPQVVMFVGLTHATLGLDHVRPGRRDDPDAAHPRFRTLTRPLVAGFALGVGLLIAILAMLFGG
jgi:hypothetical protein